MACLLKRLAFLAFACGLTGLGCQDASTILWSCAMLGSRNERLSRELTAA